MRNKDEDGPRNDRIDARVKSETKANVEGHVFQIEKGPDGRWRVSVLSGKVTVSASAAVTVVVGSVVLGALMQALRSAGYIPW